MADIIIIGILAAVVFLILRGRFHKTRGGQCQGGCSGCPGCGCGAKPPVKDTKG